MKTFVLPLLCALAATLVLAPAAPAAPPAIPAAALPVATSHSFPPLSLAAAAAAPVTTHVLWTNVNGSISLWNYTDAGAFTQITYGPYAG